MNCYINIETINEYIQRLMVTYLSELFGWIFYLKCNSCCATNSVIFVDFVAISVKSMSTFGGLYFQRNLKAISTLSIFHGTFFNFLMSSFEPIIDL